MKNLLIPLAIILSIYASTLNAQIIQGSFEGTELACRSEERRVGKEVSSPV